MKREFIFLAFGNLVSNGLIALTNIVLASILTPSDYAITRVAASYTFLLLLLSHFAMYDSICGKLRKVDSIENIALIKTACATSMVLALMSLLAFSVYAKLLSNWTSLQAGQIILIVACIIILAPATILSNTLQLRADNKTFAQYQLSNGLSQFIFGTALSYLMGIAGWALSRSLNAAVGLWVCSRKYKTELSSVKIKPNYILQLIKTSTFHVISGICSIFVLCGDILLLDWENTNEEIIGAYGLAATLCKASYFIPNIMGKYQMTHLIANDPITQHQRCTAYKKQIILIGIGAAIAIYSAVYILSILGAFKHYSNLLHYTLLCSLYTPLAFYWTAIYTTNLVRGINSGFAYQGIAAALGMLGVFFVPKPLSIELNTCISVIAGYATGIATYLHMQAKSK